MPQRQDSQGIGSSHSAHVPEALFSLDTIRALANILTRNQTTPEGREAHGLMLLPELAATGVGAAAMLPSRLQRLRPPGRGPNVASTDSPMQYGSPTSTEDVLEMELALGETPKYQGAAKNMRQITREWLDARNVKMKAEDLERKRAIASRLSGEPQPSPPYYPSSIDEALAPYREARDLKWAGDRAEVEALRDKLSAMKPRRTVEDIWGKNLEYIDAEIERKRNLIEWMREQLQKHPDSMTLEQRADQYRGIRDRQAEQDRASIEFFRKWLERGKK